MSRSRRTSRARSLADFEPSHGDTSAGLMRATPAGSGEPSVTVNGSSLVLTFPEPTPSLNELNWAHWSRKRKERQKWGWYVKAAALKLPRVEAPEVAAVTICRYGARLLDRTNLVGGCKSLEDALVAEGFLVDDSEKHYRPTYQQCASSERKTVVVISGVSDG